MVDHLVGCLGRLASAHSSGTGYVQGNFEIVITLLVFLFFLIGNYPVILK